MSSQCNKPVTIRQHAHIWLTRDKVGVQVLPDNTMSLDKHCKAAVHGGLAMTVL